MKHFESREKLDEMLLLDAHSYAKEPCQNIERISIQKELSYLGVEISTNMDFYFKNTNELDTGLMRKVSDLDLKNVQALKKIELFYRLMIKIFGEDEIVSAEDDSKPDNNDTLFEKCFILRDFHKYLDGNYMYGSARRGDYYLIFNYVF
jgi:hypothetical protein